MTQRLAGIYHWMITTLAAHQYSLIALQTVIDGDPPRSFLHYIDWRHHRRCLWTMQLASALIRTLKSESRVMRVNRCYRQAICHSFGAQFWNEPMAHGWF